MLDDIYLLPTGTGFTPRQLHIEDIVEASALDTLCSVVERSLDGTVVDTSVQLTPLEILVNQVNDGLSAQDPVAGVEVGLEHCRLK